MSFLITVIAKIFDPISILTVLIVILFSRNKIIIPIATIVGACVTETLLTMMQTMRDWGDGIGPGIVASGFHAAFLYWRVEVYKEKKGKE